MVSLSPLVLLALVIFPLNVLPKLVDAFHPSSRLLTPIRHDVALHGQSNPHPPAHGRSRRNFLDDVLTVGITAAGLATCITTELIPPADAAEEELIDVYFGCGCFWHVQHEFAEAERRILNRSDEELTARTGYAGGKAGALDGKVCYHNGKRISDYGSLGHAEVVWLRIPPSSYKDFALEYSKLFDKNGYRPDQGSDRGSEYRNLVGFPGGAKSEIYLKQLVTTSQANGDKLSFAEGSGDDPDRRALVYVMDTNVYPPFIAEQYHQFHDGFAAGENYPRSYNDLAVQLSKAGTLGESKCPNGML